MIPSILIESAAKIVSAPASNLFTPLITGTDSECRPMQMARIFFRTNDRLDPPVSSHRDLSLTTIGARSSRWCEVNLVSSHVHLDHFGL